jgi:chromosome segregation ATPase
MPGSTPIPIAELTCPHCKNVQWVPPRFFGQSISCTRCAQPLHAMDTLKINCPTCAGALQVEPKFFGREVSCTHCQQTFRLSQFMRVPCPHCGLDVRLRPEYIGERVTCKFCVKSFQVVPTSTSAPVAPAAAVAKPDSKPFDNQIKILEQEIARIRQSIQGQQSGGKPGSEADSVFVVDPPARVEEQIESAKKELEKARAENERLRSQCSALEGRVDSGERARKDLQKDLQASRVEAQRWQSDLVAQKSENARLTQTTKDLEAIRSERDQLLSVRKAEKEELKQLRGRLNEIGRSLTEAVARQQAEEARRNELENQRRRLEEDNRAREEQIRIARQQAESLRQERDAERNTVATLKQQALDWDRERQTLLEQWHREHSEKVDAIEQRHRDEQASLLTEQGAQLHAVRVELEQQRRALDEAVEQHRREADTLRQERDSASEQMKTALKCKEAEQRTLESRLGEVGQRAQQELERLQSDLGRSEATRRLLEQENQDRMAELDKVRNELSSFREQHAATRTAVETGQRASEEERAKLTKAHEEQRRALTADVERSLAECDAMRRERDAARKQVDELRKSTSEDRLQSLDAARREFETKRNLLHEEGDRNRAQVETLRNERDAFKRQAETLRKEAREKAEAKADELQSLREQVQKEQQKNGELDKRLRTELASAADLRKQLEKAQQSSPEELQKLRKEVEQLRKAREEAETQTNKSRQLGKSWEDEKRSLIAHHQEEFLRMTEEFEQRLRAEIAKTRENFEGQIEVLRRERDTARANFEALKKEMYHPKPADDDGIPQLPEPDDDIPATRAGPFPIKPPSGELTQLQTALRKSRQQLDEERRRYEEERQGLLEELQRLRPRGASRSRDTTLEEDTPAVKTETLHAPPRSRALKVFLYVFLFFFAVAAVIIGSKIMKP